MRLSVNLSSKSYDIVIERGAINKLCNYFDTNRKIMVITDDGVPKEHLEKVTSQCENCYHYIVKQGEISKSFSTFEEICKTLLKYNFDRNSLIIALGGGVIGDLAGFVAASYMRGISFINIPTTTLSQIDSSIGGKVAVNLSGVKNIIGAFYHPDIVIIDSNTLSTLPVRHFNNGLVEAIKAGLIYDAKLFELFESGDINEQLDEIIYRSLLVKKEVVEQDEKEENIRKILNFGHTIGHAIESAYGLSELLHGECVAIGMLPMIENDALKSRVLAVYRKLALDKTFGYNKNEILKIMSLDKKAHDDKITVVKVKTLGKATLCDINKTELENYI